MQQIGKKYYYQDSISGLDAEYKPLRHLAKDMMMRNTANTAILQSIRIANRLPLRLLSEELGNLLGNLLHAFHGWMARLLIDVVELNAGHAVVLADGKHRGVDVFPQIVVEDEIDACVDVSVRHVLQHVCHSRTELEEVGLRNAFVFIFADGFARPAVVGCSKDEDDVRAAKIRHAGVEGTQGVVGPVIAAIANGRA